MKINFRKLSIISLTITVICQYVYVNWDLPVGMVIGSSFTSAVLIIMDIIQKKKRG
jgi:hypothetical protein